MRSILIATIFLVASTVSAQRVTVSLPIEIDRARYTLLGKVGDYNMLFLDSRREFKLLAFDKEMHKLWTRSLREEPADVSVSGIYALNKQIEFFYSTRVKDSTYLIHRTYNVQSVPVDSTIVLKKDKVMTRSFLFTRSEDKSKVLFFNPIHRKTLQLYVYDVIKKKLLWKDVITFDESVNNEFQFIEISNSGTVFLVFDENNNRFRRNSHHLKVYTIHGENTVTVERIDFEDRLTTQLSGKYDNQNHLLLIAGFYSDHSQSESNGLFLFRAGRKSAGAQSYFKSFDKETIYKLLDKRQRNVNGISDLKIADILLTQGGGVVICGEIRKEYFNRMNYASGFSPYGSGSVDYYYEDIVAIALSSTDEYLWTRVIHKRQYSQDDNAVYSSFFVFRVPSFLELIFNDEISRNSTVSAFGMNGLGEVNRFNLMSTGLQDLRIRFTEAIQTSSSSFIAPSDYKGELKLVYVQF